MRRPAGILNVALTKRNGIPMCGVPHHAAQGYIARLIRAGKRVAIGEQMGEPVPGKLVARELSEIITAGTVTDGRFLDANKSHYLAAVFREEKKSASPMWTTRRVNSRSRNSMTLAPCATN